MGSKNIKNEAIAKQEEKGRTHEPTQASHERGGVAA